MFLKINELNCNGDDLYSLDFFKDYKNKFIKCENGSNTRINLFHIEYKEQKEVYSNLGLDLFYCEFNDCYYIKNNEKNMKILVDMLNKYNVKVTNFEILYTNYNETYINKIDIFIDEKLLLKYGDLKNNVFSILNEELRNKNIDLYFFNEVYFICKSKNNNFGLFSLDNLNYLVNEITTNLNNKLKENNIKLSINFKSVDIKIDEDEVKYINKLLFNFMLLKK